MKLPRVHCERCGRPIAAGPVAGRLGRGRLFRHDAPDVRRDADGFLVSCSGSHDVVELPVGQLEFDIPEPDPGPEAGPAQADDEMAVLF